MNNTRRERKRERENAIRSMKDWKENKYEKLLASFFSCVFASLHNLFNFYLILSKNVPFSIVDYLAGDSISFGICSLFGILLTLYLTSRFFDFIFSVSPLLLLLLFLISALCCCYVFLRYRGQFLVSVLLKKFCVECIHRVYDITTEWMHKPT